MRDMNRIFGACGTTIFTVMSALATEKGAINLGQGFPDDEGPDDLRQIAAQAILDGPNQYPPMMGIPELRQAVAAHNKHFYDLDIDWRAEVIVTSGATEAIADAVFALVNPGDEVVLIEPLYDCYLPVAQHAGAVVKTIRLTPPEWRLDEAMLDAVFSDKTKAILLNSPMNPAAKVFSDDELALIAKYVQKYDAYAICDEVYEHLVFDGRKHHPLMTLDGMRERCIRIGSAGKSFSLTGWKIGYITADKSVASVIAKAHQFITFTSAPHLQKAVAHGLQKDDTYFTGLSADLARKRELLAKGLSDIGFPCLTSEGTYFLIADITPFAQGRDDAEFCMYLTEEIGVAAVPVSAFYASDAPKNYIRFCFCKADRLLEDALARLSVLKKV